MRLCAILTFAALVAAAPAALATTHEVDAAGGADFETIWAAVDAAATGDTISVAGGIYTGDDNRAIHPNGRNLVFLADDSARIPVVIDCEGEEHAFRFDAGEDATTIVRGFTVMNAYSATNGGAMQLINSSPTFEDCIFINCVTDRNGGVITTSDSSPTFTDCVFRGNTARDRGGVLNTNRGSHTFTGCLFDNNQLVSEDFGGGALYLNSSEDEFSLCTFVENDLDQILIYSTATDASIVNCIIANSTAGRAVGILASGVGMVRHCVVYGNAEDDSLECEQSQNLFVDPLFCDDTVDDYTLCDDSLAIEGNNPWTQQVGAFGSGCGPCGSPVEASSWGRVKALYQ